MTQYSNNDAKYVSLAVNEAEKSSLRAKVNWRKIILRKKIDTVLAKILGMKVSNPCLARFRKAKSSDLGLIWVTNHFFLKLRFKES